MAFRGVENQLFTESHIPKTRYFDRWLAHSLYFCAMKWISITYRVALWAFTVTLATSAFGQIIDPEEAAKQKAENRANNKIDNTIDKGFDKAEETIGNLFKKKDKGSSKDLEEQEDTNSEIDMDENGNAVAASSGPKGLVAYSKFDFIPGEKVIAYEDFSQDAVGDFPAKWNSNTSGEVVTIDGSEGKWLNVSENGIFYPEFIKDLPENFTLEFEMGYAGDISLNGAGIRLIFADKIDNLLRINPYSDRKVVAVSVQPEHQSTSIYTNDADGSRVVENSNGQEIWTKENPQVKVSIWRQKGRIRMYLDEKKVWDIPRAFDASANYQLVFERDYFYPGSFYMRNVRLAVGAPDTRSKLITEGKLVTRGITFDVNSAKIKSESYPVLKDIAAVLTENPTVKVRIVGHTDSDGNAAANLALSKSRAVSVATALEDEFGITADRLVAEGKGDTEPSEPNTTPQGKANNRRVEFVKL